MANYDDTNIDLDDLAEDIEPGCNFGYVVAKELQETNQKIRELHQELYQNGYVDDINKLVRYVEEKESEEDDRIDFRQKVKITLISGLSAGFLGALFTWLFSSVI